MGAWLASKQRAWQCAGCLLPRAWLSACGTVLWWSPLSCYHASSQAMAAYYILAKQVVQKYPVVLVSAWAYLTGKGCQPAPASAVPLVPAMLPLYLRSAWCMHAHSAYPSTHLLA